MQQNINIKLSDEKLYNVAIDVKSFRLVQQLLDENPWFRQIIKKSDEIDEVLSAIKAKVDNYLEERIEALEYYRGQSIGNRALKKLEWRDYAALRILDYIDHTGQIFTDPNIKLNKIAVNNPFRLLYMAAKYGTGGAHYDFFMDMLWLFRQFSGAFKREVPSEKKFAKWLRRHPSGLDAEINKIRTNNKKRIINIIINKIDEGTIRDKKYTLSNEKTYDAKFRKVEAWWDEHLFHLRFAIRDPDYLNEMLNYSLSPETMKMLRESIKKGIPLFVNPYYLSLLNINMGNYPTATDSVIRDYVLPNKSLLNEFGKISAWEKEDLVKHGKPNAAGWLLPSDHNVHRRYPEVAILIPDTVGRACGGLCVSCQRMFDFQKGLLNFNLEKLKPKQTWPDKLHDLLSYFRNDSQLRDILITGGDALMSSDKSLKLILDYVYEMAKAKIEDNIGREEGEKFAEMQRIRLGTRLPVYLPQRITPDLAIILKEFREKASQIGITQFVIQTHFQSAMEITPEVVKAVERLQGAGWIVVNQMVFTAAASVRGHTAKLRKVLNDIGILSYYTFTVKGFLENSYNFTPNARMVQERHEEKYFGHIPKDNRDRVVEVLQQPDRVTSGITALIKDLQLPFLATDRNVLNLPGVGKSMTFRVVGITRYGKRILMFDHDSKRRHSPMVEKMGKVYIVESKSINAYLSRLDSLGENINEYQNIWGYSLSETEARMSVYDYPAYNYALTSEISNFEMPAN